MSNIVDLHPRTTAFVDDDQLVADLARFADNTLSKEAVKARHRLSDADWVAMGKDEKFVRAVEAEKLRRIRSGQTKRERAQNEIIDGPPILAKIMRDPAANARHVIDAVKTLDGLASDGAEAPAAGTRFVISINLSADGNHHVEHYDKSIKPDVNDITPQEILPAIAAKKSDEGDDGAGHL